VQAEILDVPLPATIDPAFSEIARLKASTARDVVATTTKVQDQFFRQQSEEKVFRLLEAFQQRIPARFDVIEPPLPDLSDMSLDAPA
jgi:hypothetical protein